MVAPLPGADPGTGSTPESGVEAAGLRTPLTSSDEVRTDEQLAAAWREYLDDVRDEIAWIDEQLRRPIVIPSANATARRERLRRERARLEALLG